MLFLIVLSSECGARANTFRKMPFLPFGCITKNVSRTIPLIVDGKAYLVPSKDLFQISACHDGVVEWFSVSSVTQFHVTLEIRAKFTGGGESRNPTLRSYMLDHKGDPENTYGLIHWPELDTELDSGYFQFSSSGEPIMIHCGDKHKTASELCTFTSYIDGTPKITYIFYLDQLAKWQQIDHEVRNYVADITMH